MLGPQDVWVALALGVFSSERVWPQGRPTDAHCRTVTRRRRRASLADGYAIQTDLMLTNSRMPNSESSRP
jgi:hypothetical protein